MVTSRYFGTVVRRWTIGQFSKKFQKNAEIFYKKLKESRDRGWKKSGGGVILIIFAFQGKELFWFEKNGKILKFTNVSDYEIRVTFQIVIWYQNNQIKFKVQKLTLQKFILLKLT